MNRKQSMKVSRKELKVRLVTAGKEAQDKSGEELTSLMDEARTVREVLDEIKAREELAKIVQAAAEEDEGPDGDAGKGAETKNQVRVKSDKALKVGAKTTYNTKKTAKPVAILSTITGVVMPYHTSPDITPTFNNVSSPIDHVTAIPFVGGGTYSRPYVKSHGDGVGGTTEGADYNTSESKSGYVEIARKKVTAYAEEPEETQELTGVDYDGVIEDNVTRAIRRYVPRQILVGDGTSGRSKGIFCNPASESGDIINRNTDITIVTAVADDTLDGITHPYGRNEEVEGAAVLIFSKKNLKKSTKLRDKQSRKVYTIVSHGNTGTIDKVPYIIDSACAEIGRIEDAYCMAYGSLSDYEVTVSSDIETAKFTDHEFKPGQICYESCIFIGGDVVAGNGFIRVRNPVT